MAGSKRNKLKKALPPQHASPPSAPIGPEDDDLMDDLLAQLDSRDSTVQSESAHVLNEMQLSQKADQSLDTRGKQDAKSRFKARQARKAAALAQAHPQDDPLTEERLEREAKEEERDIDRICRDLLLQVHEINPDGHCLYSAVADQLALLGLVPPQLANYASVRQAASQYMFTHPNDFIPFLPSVVEENGGGTLDSGLMAPDAFERYCASIRDTAVWGGEPEILALSRAYDVPIHVIQGGRPPIVVHNPRETPTERDTDNKRVVRISYHRKLYGLGEHYNSLHPSGALSQISQKMHAMLSA